MVPEEQEISSKYEVRQQIGKGSFGSAFLVTNKQDRKDYVLKRVRLAKQTQWQRTSTLQEQKLVTTLQHPFIVPCIETWTVQAHTVNMIYGYCENGDLATYLQTVQRKKAQVDEGLMMKWLCQLLLALDYLQAKQVLHRDIKTSNLLLTSEMDVQIGDFGLATVMQNTGGGCKPEDTNLVGTPHYMSPELLSCKEYGFKTDVWSLGCVFYELTAQRPTFNAFNIHGLVSKIKKNKLAPLPNNYSSEWKDIINMMLSKNPEHRPSTQELMALSSLRPAMLQARQRAQQLWPGVQLPPLLDPKPFTLPPPVSNSSGSAADTQSNCEQAYDAGNGGISWSELPSLHQRDSPARVQNGDQLDLQHGLSSLQGAQQWHDAGTTIAMLEQLQQHSLVPDDVQLHQHQTNQHHSEGSGSEHVIDTSRRRISISSQGSQPNSTPTTPGSTILGKARQLSSKHVHQPGISKTAAERVAAAIAAARRQGGTADDHSVEGFAVTSPTAAAAAKAGSHNSSNKSIKAQPGTFSTQQDAAAALGYRLASFKERKAAEKAAAVAAAGKSTSKLGLRPASARGSSGGGTVRSSPRPAWNAGTKTAAGVLQRSNSAQGLDSKPKPRPESNAAAKAADKEHTAVARSNQKSARTACARRVGSAQQSSAEYGTVPPSATKRLAQSSKKKAGYLHSLEQDLHIQQQQPSNTLAGSAQQAGSRLTLKQKACSTTPTLQQSKHALHEQQHKQQQGQPAQPRPGAVPPLLLQQQQSEQPALTFTTAQPCMDIDTDSDDVDECNSSDGDDTAIKRLRFDSVSPAPCIQTSEATTPAATLLPGLAALAVSPGASTLNLYTAAHPGWEASNAAHDCSSLLCGGQPVSSSSMQAVNASVATATSGSMEVDAGSTDASSTGPSRWHLLESTLSLLGGLYARRRWHEMGSVLSSPGLLPDAVRGSVLNAMAQSQPAGEQVSTPAAFAAFSPTAQSPSAEGKTVLGPTATAAISAAMDRKLKLGDIVVLGRNRSVKGRIRYLGPVSWDTSGDDWVGMELDNPCGMHGTQDGIQYFDCPPNTASFHKATKLTAFDSVKALAS